nr:putative harbinger transposase-derived protein [Tanacetum cinerariifolium]
MAAKMSAPFVSSLRRDVRGGKESAQLFRISDLLDTMVLSNMGDRRFWDLNGDGCFRVKDVRRMLDDMLLPKSDVPSRWLSNVADPIQSWSWWRKNNVGYVAFGGDMTEKASRVSNISRDDAFDEYLQMSEHTARDALFFFHMCIIELYMPKYLRKPTSEVVVNIQQKHNNVHGFSKMLRSIDCMHWEWKNCPVSWQGQYGKGD